MKTKTFILLSLLICNLLPAQNVKLDIKPHFLGVRADSLFVSMDISVEIDNLEELNKVQKAIRKVDSVYEVRRKR